MKFTEEETATSSLSLSDGLHCLVQAWDALVKVGETRDFMDSGCSQFPRGESSKTPDGLVRHLIERNSFILKQKWEVCEYKRRLVVEIFTPHISSSELCREPLQTCSYYFTDNNRYEDTPQNAQNVTLLSQRLVQMP